MIENDIVYKKKIFFKYKSGYFPSHSIHTPRAPLLNILFLYSFLHTIFKWKRNTKLEMTRVSYIMYIVYLLQLSIIQRHWNT